MKASHGESVLNTAFIECLNGTMRERLACLTRKCRHAPRRVEALETGMYLLGCTYNFCFAHQELSKAEHKGSVCTPAAIAGVTDHVWSIEEVLTYKVAPAPCGSNQNDEADLANTRCPTHRCPSDQEVDLASSLEHLHQLVGVYHTLVSTKIRYINVDNNISL